MRRRYHWTYLLCLVTILTTLCFGCSRQSDVSSAGLPQEQEMAVKLPEPRYDSNVSIEQSLLLRRSTRSYTGEPLTLQEVSQLLWAAQGITDPIGYRTAPSAGALYPLEIYIVAGNVQDLSPGVYRYEPEEHRLVRLMDSDMRNDLANTALGQGSVKEGAIVFVFTAVYERTTGKYGDRGVRYVHIEVGHAAQNLCLQAAAIGLGAVTVGAFQDEQVAALMNLPGDEQPLYIIPAGRK
ncbi:hypothetical protein ES703_33209 [subsurface metagenome]